MSRAAIIIVTYNAEKYIERCLNSLINQTYKKKEIILVDNYSGDKTIEIAKKFKVKIIFNKIKNAKISKKIGLNQSKGDLIYFGDSDVIIEDKNWLSAMVEPFVKEKNIFASECKWGIAKDFSITNRYCALLGIADPVARMISQRKPNKIEKKGNYDLYYYKNGQNPVLYCVLWKKDLIEYANKDYRDFNEGRTPTNLIYFGYNKVAHIKISEAHHYYAENFTEFIKKRSKTALRHLKREKEENSTWIKNSGSLKLYLSIIYCFSIIFPFFESIKNILKDKHISWIIHSPMCFVTLSVYYYNFLKDKVL